MYNSYVFLSTHRRPSRIDSTSLTRKEPLTQPPQLLLKKGRNEKSHDDKHLKCNLLNPGSLGPKFSPGTTSQWTQQSLLVPFSQHLRHQGPSKERKEEGAVCINKYVYQLC